MNQGTLLYLVILFAAFYFLFLRPQQTQQKKRQQMMNEMQPGAKVVTIGGICGTLVKVTDEKVFIEISEGVIVEMLRNSISTVTAAEDADENDDEEDDEFDDIDLDDIELDEEELYYDVEEEQESK